MTKRIHVLEPQVAELIAAGEVVERPASVVKELVENASGRRGTRRSPSRSKTAAFPISASLTTAGGIAQKDDLPAAFLRHATSKVRHGRSDFEQPSAPLGFRGEALASIAAVCPGGAADPHSRRAAGGTRYVIEGGAGDGLLDDAGCPRGDHLRGSGRVLQHPGPDEVPQKGQSPRPAPWPDVRGQDRPVPPRRSPSGLSGTGKVTAEHSRGRGSAVGHLCGVRPGVRRVTLSR